MAAPFLNFQRDVIGSINPQKVAEINDNVNRDINGHYGEKFPETRIADLPGMYFLGVGMTNPRKNLACLLDGFREFRGKHPGYSLVLTGHKYWIESATAFCIRKAGIIYKVVSIFFCNRSIFFLKK